MTAASTNPDATTAAEHGEHLPHVLPLRLYLGVWGVLMIGTIVTVLAAGIHFGEFNIWIAMMIAVVKATFVGLFFMHLAYDRLLYSVILASSLLFVGLFICLSALDTHQYKPSIRTDMQIVLDGK